MRELWQTGYMHNPVRMVAASFLVKHLRLHWTHGEAWFWETLLDADLANNAAGWQWVSGSGADASPYFRISILSSRAESSIPPAPESENVPQVGELDTSVLFAPWEVSPMQLASAAIKLGET